jgi:hypothetical protein
LNSWKNICTWTRAICLWVLLLFSSTSRMRKFCDGEKFSLSIFKEEYSESSGFWTFLQKSRSPVILSVIHHCQNPIGSLRKFFFFNAICHQYACGPCRHLNGWFNFIDV